MTADITKKYIPIWKKGLLLRNGKFLSWCFSNGWKKRMRMSFFPFPPPPPPETLYGRGCLGNGERRGCTYIKKKGDPPPGWECRFKGGGVETVFFWWGKREWLKKKSSFFGLFKRKRRGNNPLSSSLNFASLLAGRPVKREKTRINILCMPKNCSSGRYSNWFDNKIDKDEVTPF